MIKEQEAGEKTSDVC
ncbi:hypothetical protein, partial [Paracoccus sp. JM45]